MKTRRILTRRAFLGRAITHATALALVLGGPAFADKGGNGKGKGKGGGPPAGHGPGNGQGSGNAAAAGTADTAPERVTVCHKPGTSAEKDIKISREAVQAHLEHGDRPGSCTQEQRGIRERLRQ